MADELNGRIQEIEKSVATLDSQMRAQISSVQSSTRTVLVVGIILIAIIFAYLTYLTSKIREEIEPSRLAETMEALARNQVPALEESLKAQAPEVVAGLRKEAMNQIPVLREFAETKALELIDTFGDKLDGKVDAIVDELLKGHQKELKPLIEAASAPGNAAKLEEAFQDSLENLIGPKLDEALLDFDRTMSVIVHRLDRLLQPDEKLTPDERAEKELIRAMLSFIDDIVKEQVSPSPEVPTVTPKAPAPAPTTPGR